MYSLCVIWGWCRSGTRPAGKLLITKLAIFHLDKNLKKLKKKKDFSQALVAHAFNLIAREAEAGGSL